MAASELDNHTEDHSSFIRTPTQLLTVIFLAFVVPIGVLVMLATWVTTGGTFDKNHPAMSDAAIAQRIKPVAEVNMVEGGAAQAQAVPAVAAAPAAASAPPAMASAPVAATVATPAPAPGAAAPTLAAAADGKAIFDKVCMVCHATGVAGAPKAGDKAAWAPRLKQGIDVLHATAIKGKGAMPPKGGAMQLSDAEIMAAVDYMIGLVK